MGGASRCAGEVQVKQLGMWRNVINTAHNLEEVTALCERLDCGFAVGMAMSRSGLVPHKWEIKRDCAQAGSPLRECLSFSVITFSQKRIFRELICSGKQIKILWT